jgi:hypothetical protein
MKNSDYEIFQMLRGHAESLMEQATSATGASGGAVGQDRRCPEAALPPRARSIGPPGLIFDFLPRYLTIISPDIPDISCAAQTYLYVPGTVNV